MNAPRPAATAVESRNANTSTGRLIETLSSRGRFRGASASSARHARERSQYAEAAAGQREQQGLGEELTDQPSARRAERAANGELALSRRRLRQQQIRHVRARHQQQKADRAEQEQSGERALPVIESCSGDDQSVLEQIVALLARRHRECAGRSR